MKCSRCHSDNREGAKFCGECAAPLSEAIVCSQCGTPNPTSRKFCDSCGHRLPGEAAGAGTLDPRSYTPKHLADRILAEHAAMEARGAVEGERKTITALFADIQGSVQLIENLDPEEARRIVDPALQLMMDAVHRYEGYVAQSRGDGILALFGAPIAHEDHPLRATYAALRMQEDIKSYAAKLRLEKGVNLEIRVGLNTGEVVLRSIRTDDLHTDYVPIGHSTNLAARLEGLATGGAVVVSGQTHRLIEGFFEFRSLGAARVKGVSEPVEIYEVSGVGPLRTRLQVAVRRGLARFVGRQSEMEQLRRALDLARSGHGQIVAVVGGPGVGKSRLFYEFRMTSQEGCLVLETFSVSHGKAYPYLPLIELLKNYFQITLDDDERRRREKVTGRALTLDRSLEDALPYLLALLGIETDPSLQQMAPELRRRRTFDAIKRLLLRESLDQPLLVVFEDLHWLDAETEALLGVLAEGVATARILLLVNYRPEYRHGWGNRTYYSQIRLDPLGRESTEEMLTELLGAAPALRPLRQLIADRTDGTPFFMEEIVQSLFDRGVLVRKTGEVVLTTPVTEIRIPTTVEAVLAARIDRLGAAEKELVQTLAVMGREFPASLLRRVSGLPEGELEPLISHLSEAEFVYEQPGFPEVGYIFKHALTQDVAYNSLLLERRSALHEQTARAIEGLYGDRLEEHYSELAHHYSRSRNRPKAVEYQGLAGEQAARRSANVEAISHLIAALELLQALPETADRAEQELRLQIALGPALIATKGYAAPELGRAFTRARELCQATGETPQLVPILRTLAFFYLLVGDLDAAREMAEQCLRVARALGLRDLLLEGHFGMGAVTYFRGELGEALEHLDRSFALYDRRQHRCHAASYGQDPGVACHITRARVLWHLGFPDQARDVIHEGVALAREISHPYTLSFALSFAAIVHQFRGEPHAVEEHAEASSALANDQGFPLLRGCASVMRGWALSKTGRPEEGVALMREGLAVWRGAGAQLEYWPPILAEALSEQGRADEALAVVQECLDTFPKNGMAFYEADLWRLKGELVSPAAERESCLRRAIDVTRRQGAKSLELRAVRSLSRLLRSQEKCDEARQMLAEIYGWFTEGFDTADLKDAKALLEELS